MFIILFFHIDVQFHCYWRIVKSSACSISAVSTLITTIFVCPLIPLWAWFGATLIRLVIIGSTLLDSWTSLTNRHKMHWQNSEQTTIPSCHQLATGSMYSQMGLLIFIGSMDNIQVMQKIIDAIVFRPRLCETLTLKLAAASPDYRHNKDWSVPLVFHDTE